MSVRKILPDEEEASAYFNSLPREQRAKLVPLLEGYRRRGLLDALDHLERARVAVKERVGDIETSLSKDSPKTNPYLSPIKPF